MYRSRRNAATERRLVYLSIEMLSSTKTARLAGKGVKLREIKEYTKLYRVAIDAALKWLVSNGVIQCINHNQWIPKSYLPDGWCWKHGIHPDGYNGCLQCNKEAINANYNK